MNIPEEPTEFGLFKEELYRRFTEPKKYITFVFYFAFVIFLLAGIGWIIPLVMVWYYGVGHDYKELSIFSQSLSTYAIALAATSFVDLVISKDDPKISRRPFKNLFSMAVMFSFIIVVALTLWTFSAMSIGWSLFLAILGTILSLIIWWVANGDNAQYMEEPPSPSAATGGDPSKGAPDPKALEGGLN